MERQFSFSEDEFYHVYNRGVEKRKIFMSGHDYERFMALLYVANSSNTLQLSDFRHKRRLELFVMPRTSTLVDIGAYCLMPNHFHLLIREKKQGGISTFMLKLGTAYSMYFNKKYQRSGPLFSKPFKATHVTRDVHLRHLFVYTHLNPLELIDRNWKDHMRVGSTRKEGHLESYEYSSYLDYMGSERPQASILTKATFPKYFNSMTDFKNYLDDWVNLSKSGELTQIVKGSP